MTTDTWRILLRGALVGGLLLVGTNAMSQELPPSGAVKDGGFVGVTFVPRFTFDGVTFNGESGYREENGDELVLLPRVDSQPMFRGVLGYRSGVAALEISYDRSQMTGSFVGFPMNATYQSVNVDGRVFFARRSRVQPHVVVGGSFPFLSIKDGGILHEEVANARFRGWGLNTEAGVTIYPVRQVGFGVGYLYRAIWFDRVSGVTDKLYYLRPRFRETAGSIVFSGTFIM